MTNNPTIDGVSRCKKCRGSGWIDNLRSVGATAAKCPDCAPAVERQEPDMCKKCGGVGFLPGTQNCHRCHGSGSEPVDVAALQSTIAQLQARIGELESGRGEAAGHVFTMEALVPGGDVRCHAVLYQSLPNGAKLYTAPPAPVAVVLPERIKSNFYGEFSPYDSGWNACLDATAALNGDSHCIDNDQAAKTAAVRTLEGKGYTYGGGQLWKPPLGKKPDFDLIDQPKGSGSLDFDGLLAEFHSVVWEAAADEDSKTDYDLAGVDIAKKLQAMYRDKPVQPSAGDEPITIEAVAVTREGDDGLYLEWTIEGGIAALESAGMVLFACPEANDMCVEEGSCEIYLQPVDLDATEQRGFIRGMKAENNANHELRHQLDDYAASLQVERDELQNLLQLLDQTPLDEWYRKSLNVKVAESLRKLKNNPKPLTYYSSQATKCAGCMVHKHTPLRVDQMGGYVCLTCILNELLRLLAEESARDAEPDWEGFEEISDLPRVQEALTNFSADSTGDNGIAVVQAIVLATTRKPSE